MRERCVRRAARALVQCTAGGTPLDPLAGWHGHATAVWVHVLGYLVDLAHVDVFCTKDPTS
jgi:hypothetical protein